MKTKSKILSGILALILCFSTVFSAGAVTTEPILTPLLKNNARVAEKIVTESAVLLENKNNALPLPKAGRGAVALFGVGAARTTRIGGGSGDPWTGGVNAGGDAHIEEHYGLWHVNIYDAFKAAGYNVPTKDMMEWIGTEMDKTLPATMAWNAQYFFPEPELTEAYVKDIAKQTNTAVYVIKRNSAEGSDRTLTPRNVTPPVRTDVVPGAFQVGDYNLLPKEEENLRLLGANFDKVTVVINAPGPIDTKFFNEIPGLDALVFAGLTGSEGGPALMKLLNGTDNFSGKLIETWAKNYTDYPASATFANNDGAGNDERYVEDIYVGYRYFDTANVTPAYPFGYGLSYTNFDMDVTKVVADAKKVTATVKVTNTGKYAGKEVVEIYASAPDSAAADKEYQKLMVYAKTDLLSRGDSQELEISYNTADMAYYNETSDAYVLDPGNYFIRVGNSSRNTKVAAVLNLPTRVVTEQLADYMTVPMNILEEREPVWTKSGKGWTPYTYASEAAEKAAAPVIAIGPENFVTLNNVTLNDDTATTYTTDPNYVGKTRGYQNSSMNPSATTLGFTGSMVEYNENVVLKPKENVTLLDVYKGTKTLQDLVAQMSNLELAQLNAATGQAPYEGYMTFNDPTKIDSVRGCATGTTDLLQEKYGIPLMLVNDGPGGLRVTEKVTAYDAANNYQATPVYNFSTSWPASINRSQTWNQALMEEFGVAYGQEMASMGIAVLLGTSLNIHRDPLCGRNFEYYSEDPVVNGFSASAITKGLQSNPGIMACLKHFAGNQQETRRGGGNSVMTIRALREIYLKGFEIGVKSAQPASIMTSYNRINNVPAADDIYLLENITRGEWGFKGQIMTDWGGGSSTPAKSMHAGNDMISPGGNNQVVAILRNVDPNPIFKENGEIAEALAFSSASITKTLLTNGSTLSTTGANIVRAPLGTGYTAALSADPTTPGGNIYYIEVNGQRIARTVTYTPYVGPRAGAEAGVGRNVTNYLTSDYATIEDGGKTLAYKVNYVALQANICRGDLQKSAIRNLTAIMYSINAKKFYERNADVNIGTWVEMVKADLHEYYSIQKSDMDPFNSITAPKTAVVDQSFTVKVQLNDNYKAIKLINENGGAITISSISRVAVGGFGNEWTFTTKIGTAGNRTLAVIGQQEDGSYDNLDLSFDIAVTQTSEAPKVLNVAAPSSAKVNVAANYTITTNGEGSYSANIKSKGASSYLGKTVVSKTMNTDGTCTWVLAVKVGSAGNRDLEAYAGNKVGTISEAYAFKVNVSLI